MVNFLNFFVFFSRFVEKLKKVFMKVITFFSSGEKEKEDSVCELTKKIKKNLISLTVKRMYGKSIQYSYIRWALKRYKS